MKKQKYNPACVEDEVSISDMLSEELDIASGDELNLENEGQSASEDSSNTSPESECESEQVLRVLMGGKTLRWAARNSTRIHLLKMQGHNFTLYQMQSPWIILVCFSVTSFCITLL
jgi:hypothetical protein